MLAAVKGYYNGSQIVMKEKIKMIREGETLFSRCCQTQKNRVSETSQIVQKPCPYAGNRT